MYSLIFVFISFNKYNKVNPGMAGIYIHIPFCRKACHYCNFHFSTSLSSVNEMVQSIVSEAILRRNYLTEKIETIYLGGGTPSLLSEIQLKIIFQALADNFLIGQNPEITLEANPDDLSDQHLSAWMDLGVNRLSVGVQSFFDTDLQWMNRLHSGQQALEGLKLAQNKGFRNISVDLIYGTPTLSDSDWNSNLEKVQSLNMVHLSAYALTVEPKTALDKMIALHKKEPVDAEKQTRQLEILMDWAENAGYEHYEISNFAKPGFRSRHNSSYWQQQPYLGLGPSAHSFNGISRQWNLSSNPAYLKGVSSQVPPFEIEHLTETQQLNEYIMTALRTLEGIRFSDSRWSGLAKHLQHDILKDAGKWEARGCMTLDAKGIRLNRKGIHFADGIASDLFR